MRKKVTKLLFVMAISIITAATAFSQGLTTSGMNGRVTGADGNTLVGATVIATHVPSGTQFAATSNDQGIFRIPNMEIGGPYVVKVSYVGNETFERKNIYLTLGQTFKLNVQLQEKALQVGEVAVIGVRNQVDVFDGNRTGAETVVPLQKIEALPTVGRDLSDFTRLTPQASVDDLGGISVAGINNRFNTLTIDGAVNNDAFGLAASGVNGGQTGGTPISMDAIEQFQIVLAPYDIRQSGFAGAGINAVTRRGTNKFTGSIYTYYRDENLSGKTPSIIQDVDSLRTKLAPFQAQTSGLRLGGPIIENKLFFFLNAEMQRDETPQPFEIANYDGDSDKAAIDGLQQYLIDEYGYDPGVYDANTRKLNSDKVLLRLDYNINRKHNLMLRHSYTKHDAYLPSRSSNRSISFYNNGQYFPSITNSTTLELKSNWANASNDLIVGYTRVRDDRDQLGDPFPAVQIYDGNGTIYFGSEPYSTANQLDQDIFTVTDNYSMYLGRHTLTFGTSNEFAGVYNLFMRKNFGEYRFYSMQDFYDNNPAQYERGYSLVDDVTGDGSAAAADFDMLQVALYAQDEFQVNDDFKLTFGVRADMPIFLTQPTENTLFNESTIPMLEAAGWDLQGAKAGQMPKSQILWSPRIGFNWDVFGNEETQIRGGVGIFTSRLPLVWPGGSYTNNGLAIGGVYYKGSGFDFNPYWDQQYTNADFGAQDIVPSGQMDLFAEDFKFPQMFRASLGLDQQLPWGVVGSLDGIFTKTLNNVHYYNVNVSPDPESYLEGADERPYYSSQSIDNTYTRIMLGTNTNEGYTYNITASLEKPFANGFTANVAYTFGRAMTLNDVTSSQNSSQWRYNEVVNGLNHLDLTYSDFDLGHRVTGFLSYRAEYFNHAATTISLFYNGQSGDRFSYVYNDYGDINGEGENTGNLIYIPADQTEIVFADAGTADQQWADLNEFIENDPYLSQHRGEYAERNGARIPFTSLLDFKVAQDFFVKINDTRHKLTLTFDVFNLGNLINSEWGNRLYVGYDTYQLIKFKGFQDDSMIPTFEFQKPKGDVWYADDSGIRSSRWMAQVGLRYSF